MSKHFKLARYLSYFIDYIVKESAKSLFEFLKRILKRIFIYTLGISSEHKHSSALKCFIEILLMYI